jgi:hypothetical protein
MQRKNSDQASFGGGNSDFLTLGAVKYSGKQSAITARIIL